MSDTASMGDPDRTANPALFSGGAPRVVTVILNWRRPDETLTCVRSLLEADYPNQHILIIDNSAGTTDIDGLLNGLPVEIIRNPANLGFTGGVNIGMRQAVASGADYVWLMNSDATTAPDALTRLVASAEANPGIGLISPVIRAPEDPSRIVFCLGLQGPDHIASGGTSDPVEAAAWLRDRQADAVLYGAALLVRRAVIDAIGGLDERFFAYVEDIDYSLRCHDAGFNVAVCFEAFAYHQFKDLMTDILPPYVHYFMNRNQMLLWRKRTRGFLLRKATMWYLYQRLLKIEREKDDPVATNALLLGLWDGLRGVGGPYDPKRLAPWWLRRTIGRRPGIVINLLERKFPWRARPHDAVV
jgi:GT2 family glycosyltransferase